MKKEIRNWGNYPVVEAEENRFWDLKILRKKLSSSDKSTLARGMGRCYGDSASQENLFNSRAHNKILDLSREKAEIHCQSGITLDQILEIIVPKGFFIPVSPGTKFVSVGGAIASDVHGKNHHKEGSFSNHLLGFELMTDDGTVRWITPENGELFYATVGGMGLTGIILSARFKLKRIETAYIKERTIKTSNLDETLEVFERTNDYTYSVAWIDCLAKGKNMGRSLVMLGEHAKKKELPKKFKKDALKTHEHPKLNIPIYFPNWILNPLSVKAFNFLFYNKVTKKDAEHLVHYDKFFYPLDGINNWNKMYGKRGFTQYQFVVPFEGGKDALIKVLKKVAKNKMASFLSVLKVFGPQDDLISFPMEGYTLTMDFAITDSLFSFLDELDEIVLAHGGRLYLTKDVRMSKDTFEKSYSNAENFKKIINKWNPNSRFSSLQSERLALTKKS